MPFPAGAPGSLPAPGQSRQAVNVCGINEWELAKKDLMPIALLRVWVDLGSCASGPADLALWLSVRPYNHLQVVCEEALECAGFECTDLAACNPHALPMHSP